LQDYTAPQFITIMIVIHEPIGQTHPGPAVNLISSKRGIITTDMFNEFSNVLD